MATFLGTAGAASAASAAMGVFGYNRDAWMINVQVNQARRFQKQQVVLSQAGMFRDDIRQMIGSAVLRQTNYVVVATLVLGVIGAYYIEGQLPSATPEYLAHVFEICIGCSLLYLSLSALCAMRGNHVATECQRDMLTTLVRLPVQELAADIDRAAPGESIQAFERQGLGKVLRLPGTGRLRSPSPTRRATSRGRAGGKGSSGSKSSPRSSERRAQPELPPASGADDHTRIQEELDEELRRFSSSVEAMNEQRKKHLAVFKVKEEEWAALGRYAVHFGLLGLHHLFQAMAYYTVAKYSVTKTADWCAFLVQFMFGLVDAILSLGFNRYTKGSCCGGFFWVISVVGSQAFLFGATRSYRAESNQELVDSICVPGIFACHLLVNCIGAVRIVSLPVGEQGPAPAGKSSEDEEGLLRPATPRSDEETQPKKGSSWRRLNLMFINGIAILGWLLCLWWALAHASRPSELIGAAQARQLTDLGSTALDGLVVDAQSSRGALDFAGLSASLAAELAGARQWREGMEERLARLNATLRERRAAGSRELLGEAMIELLKSTDRGLLGGTS